VLSLFARIRQLILPGTAQPNDPALVMGPDLPPCMRSRYAWAILGRPQGTVSGGINAPATFFIAGRSAPGVAEVDEGWLIYDQGTVCGYVVTGVNLMNNFGGGSISAAYTVGTFIAAQGVASYAGAIGYQFGSNAPNQPVQVRFGSSDGNPNQSQWFVDTVSMGRGLRASAISTVNSAAVGAEAVVLTTNSATFYNGRAYEWCIVGSYNQSAAGFWTINLRSTNLAGTIVGQVADATVVGTGPYRPHLGRFVRTAGSDLAVPIVVTLQFTGAGTVTQTAAALSPRSVYIRDCGAAGDYLNEPAI